MARPQLENGLPLPNLVYPGMGKAGSTLLYKLFEVHPDIHVSPVEKEIVFFSRNSRRSRGLDYYRSFFRGYAGQPWVLDNSPGYHSHPALAQTIRDTLGPRRGSSSPSAAGPTSPSRNTPTASAAGRSRSA